MLIQIEDYMLRRRQAQARSLKVAAGGGAGVPARNPGLPRSPARVLVLPLVTPAAEVALPCAFELGNIYAEASLI